MGRCERCGKPLVGERESIKIEARKVKATDGTDALGVTLEIGGVTLQWDFCVSCWKALREWVLEKYRAEKYWW